MPAVVGGAQTLLEPFSGRRRPAVVGRCRREHGGGRRRSANAGGGRRTPAEVGEGEGRRRGPNPVQSAKWCPTTQCSGRLRPKLAEHFPEPAKFGLTSTKYGHNSPVVPD